MNEYGVGHGYRETVKISLQHETTSLQPISMPLIFMATERTYK
jgi:hypothetical protein